MDGIVVRIDEGAAMHPLTHLAQQARDDSRRWFPDTADSLVHMGLGMSGEAGEVTNILKKIDRGDFGQTAKDFIHGEPTLDGLPQEVRTQLAGEVTDVLVYVLNMYALLGVKPDVIYATVRAANERRFGRGVQGDNPQVVG